MQTYEGFFEGSEFIPYQAVRIPEHRRAIVTVLDEPTKTKEETIAEQVAALEEIFAAIKACDADEPLGEEFDNIINQRFTLTRGAAE
ncbi:MAG: hypothetical protein LBN97_03990 [Oscillospiraceae bacterium]|jgi:hypothetical protein|nr:hypothetical protein [Oscillospiraceae bacterium]